MKAIAAFRPPRGTGEGDPTELMAGGRRPPTSSLREGVAEGPHPAVSVPAVHRRLRGPLLHFPKEGRVLRSLSVLRGGNSGLLLLWDAPVLLEGPLDVLQQVDDESDRELRLPAELDASHHELELRALELGPVPP